MAGQNNQDQFEAFFKRADLDGDGRISGAEAVGFFQGSNLPKQVLAQIWMHADQNRTGFLGRAEFYNALKLVTVAQSKRELTPDIVKAALYGPAAAKIPPPQINLSAVPAQQINALAAASTPQMGAVAPTTAQNLGFRGPGVPTMNQHHFASQQGQVTRPPQAMPLGTASHPPIGVASSEFSGRGIMGMPQPMPSGTHAHPPQTMLGGVVGPGISNVPASHPPQSMPGGVAGPGFSNVPASHPPQTVPGGVSGPRISNSSISTDWFSGGTGGTMTGIRGISPSSTTSISQPQTLTSTLSQPAINDSKALVVSGNGLATDSFFGGDVFSVAPSTKKQEPSMPTLSATSTPASSAGVPASSGGQLSFKSNSLDSLQSAFAMQPLGGQLQRAQSLPSMAQHVSTPSSSSVLTSGISVGVGNSSDNSQLTWPKMKPSDVQKYTKVFMEVDTDRDGRITGEQARNLFLSWRLPREVLKQVWDLSDQDSDSMLSLREFCFALYLMERYREGRPLPATLPSNVMYDETLLSMTGQPKASYGNPAWGPSVGFGQQPGMGPRPMSSPATNLRPPVPVPNPQPDGIMAPNQQKSRALALEDPFLSQHDSGEHNSANSMNQDGTPTEKKVGETEKVILDSKEKIEFYRTKMQDLVLSKSRCDNRLNEITERALADKREAELLGKKYEEKYKQVAEVASKLTIEEATFRDIQARKSELHQAIVHMEQGGSADGILQVRADRIQTDLDELMKALTERCKKHGLDIKSAAIIELPTGWQPGIQEGAAVWDEEWDKFEDEGFGNELTVDVKNVSTASSLLNGRAKPSIFPDTSEHAFESDSAYPHSEDELARSAQGSPAGRTASGSPTQEFSDVFAKSTEADAETHSFDESTWGAFDTNDDADSVWGINPASTKDADSEKHRDFFGIDDFGVKPIRTESPSAESVFQRKSPFFEDSVPATPASRFGNSPRYSEAGDHFDNFSRFDSFSMHEGGFSPGEKLTRFDSINSTKEFGHSRAFSSFDDSDPFGSSGPFKVSSDHQSPKKGSGNWSAF